MRKLNSTLKEAGTSFENVVYLFIILRNMDDYNELENVMKKYFNPENIPNTVIDAGLADKKLLVEVEATDVIPKTSEA